MSEADFYAEVNKILMGNPLCYVGWDGDDALVLDGGFKANELRAIADLLDRAAAK